MGTPSLKRAVSFMCLVAAALTPAAGCGCDPTLRSLDDPLDAGGSDAAILDPALPDAGPPEVTSPRWHTERVAPGEAVHLTLTPRPLLAIAAAAEARLLRRTATGWSAEYVGPASQPRILPVEPFPAVFSSNGPAVWSRSALTSYGPAVVQSAWPTVTALASSDDLLAFYAVQTVVHEDGEVRSYEVVGCTLYRLSYRGGAPEVVPVDERRPPRLPSAPRAARFDDRGALHAVWSADVYDQRFERCLYGAAAPSCEAFTTVSARSVASLHVGPGGVRLVSRRGDGALLFTEAGADAVLATGVMAVLDVAWGSDDSVHVVYSRPNGRTRSWGDPEQNLLYATRQNGVWGHELLDTVDGPATLALDDQNQPQVAFVQGEPVVRGGFNTAELWVRYGWRTAE